MAYKVRAKAMGFYGMERRYPKGQGRNGGEVFEIKEASHFSHRWMEPVDWNPDEEDGVKDKKKDVNLKPFANPQTAREPSNPQQALSEALPKPEPPKTAPETLADEVPAPRKGGRKKKAASKKE